MSGRLANSLLGSSQWAKQICTAQGTPWKLLAGAQDAVQPLALDKPYQSSLATSPSFLQPQCCERIFRVGFEQVSLKVVCDVHDWPCWPRPKVVSSGLRVLLPFSQTGHFDVAGSHAGMPAKRIWLSRTSDFGCRLGAGPLTFQVSSSAPFPCRSGETLPSHCFGPSPKAPRQTPPVNQRGQGSATCRARIAGACPNKTSWRYGA